MTSLLPSLYPWELAEAMPLSVIKHMPYLYEDEGEWCCLLGSDPQIGIFGSGSTALEALQSWDKAYQFLIKFDPLLQSIWSHSRKEDAPNYWLLYRVHLP